MDCRRELVFRSESITDCHRNVALLCQPNAKPVVALPSASTKAASVNARNRWERAVASLRPSHIKLKVLTVRVRVFNVWLEDDVLWYGDVCRFLRFGEFGNRQAHCQCDDQNRTRLDKTISQLSHCSSLLFPLVSPSISP